MVSVFLAEGFEEMEAVTPVDILRRAGIEVRTCSIGETREVRGAHGVPFVADCTLAEAQDGEEVIVLPGGMPGTLNLGACKALCQRILDHAAKGKLLAAICAAPTVFGSLGLLQNCTATCYPGMEDQLHSAAVSKEKTVYSNGILTSRGPGTAADFAFHLVLLLKGQEKAEELRRAMCFEGDRT